MHFMAETPLTYWGLWGQRVPTRGDLRLLRRAVREGWPMCAEMREMLIRQTNKAMETGPPRQVIGAARVMIAADEANRRAELEHLRALRAIMSGLLAAPVSIPNSPAP